MNAGLSNLATLKGHLLAERLRAGVTFDEQILALGLGVAAAIERFCDRRLGRVVGDTWETPCGYRTSFVLIRYPLEEITAIDLRTARGDSWESQDIDSLVAQELKESGLVTFHGPIGWASSNVRFTFTGGYWWDTTEDGSGSQPAGSTVLPADLQYAWLLHCQDVWNRRDNLGTSLTAKPADRPRVGDVEFGSSVRALLRPHQRHA